MKLLSAIFLVSYFFAFFNVTSSALQITERYQHTCIKIRAGTDAMIGIRTDERYDVHIHVSNPTVYPNAPRPPAGRRPAGTEVAEGHRSGRGSVF